MLKRTFIRFLADESGATAIEYCLIAAAIALAIIGLVNALGIHDGFSFSAGGIDYLLNLGIATKPLLLIPIGIGYAIIYYFMFT